MLNWKFNNLFDFFHLLVETSYHIVGGIGDFFHFHEGNKGIDFGGQNLMEEVGVRPDCDSETGLKIFNFDRLVDVNNVLSLMAELDEHSIFTHHFYDFPDIGVVLLESVQFFFESGN